MIIQKDAAPAFLQASDYDEKDRDPTIAGDVFATLLTVFSMPEPQATMQSVNQQPVPLFMTECCPDIETAKYGSGSFEINPDIASEMMPELQPLSISDNSYIDSDVGTSPPDTIVPASNEKPALASDIAENGLLNQQPTPPVVLTANEPKLVLNNLTDTRQQVDTKSEQDKQGKSQKPLSTLALSQLISDAKAVTPYAAVANEPKLTKDQLAEHDLPKQPANTDLLTPTSFKSVLNQANESYSNASTPTTLTSDSKQAAPYEIQYEAGQSAQASSHKASLRIHQEGLGQINVKIEMNQQQSSVTLVADNHEARQVMQAHLPQLKLFFAEANLSLNEATIEQQTSQDQPSQQQGEQQKEHVSNHRAAESLDVDKGVIKRQNQSLIDAYV